MKSPVILRVFKNSQLIEVKQFDLDQIVIGHNADVQLDLSGDSVSAIHCLIEKREGGYYLCDLGSSSGTFKNGQAVLDEPLSSGDEIQIGEFKIIFFFGVPKARPVAGEATATGEAPAESTVILPPPPPAEAAIPVPPPPPAEATIPVPPPPPRESVKDDVAITAPVLETPPVIVVPSLPPTPPPPVATPPMPPKPAASSARPEIRNKAAAKHVPRRKGPTFAPPSEIKDLKRTLKPGKGNTVEVIIAWKERVLDTVMFKQKGTYRIGSSERDGIQLNTNEIPRNWPLLNIGTMVLVNVSDAMKFELVSSEGQKTLDECLSSGKAQRGTLGNSVRLDQGDMICLSIGNQLSLYIRFAPMAPAVPLLPPLGLSGSELSGLTMALVMTALLAFYVSATTPKDLNEKPEEEVTMTAQIIFNKPPPKEPKPVPPPPPPPPPEQKPPPPPPPEKAKVADERKDTQKKGQAKNQQSQRQETAGRAAEVAPIPNSQNRPKKFTSTKQGGAIKLGEKAGANANSAKDVSKVGLFSAFGGGGVRSKLDQAYSGAGELLGQADKATGASGFAEDRAGDDLGSRFKDTGAGGKGTATQGIAGIGTKGRSSGQSAYGSVGGFGDKTSVAVEAGGAEEDFVGTIDREAVRRRVRHYLHEIRGCYNRELNRLEKGDRLEGKVVVSWEIVAQGVAKNVRIKSSTLGNPNVENCIRQRLASWSFPEPPVGLTAEVSFPFYLRPEN